MKDNHALIIPYHSIEGNLDARNSYAAKSAQYYRPYLQPKTTLPLSHSNYLCLMIQNFLSELEILP
jgi:hypothetical protein